MAAFFGSIGETLADFFDKKTYQLGRAFTLQAKDGGVSWGVETKVNAEGGVESTLSASHKFQTEKFSVKTSTEKNPKFSANSTRFAPLSATFTVEDPSLKLNCQYQKPKVALEFEGGVCWKSQNVDVTVSAGLAPAENIATGVEVKAHREGAEGNFLLTEYDLAFQFDRNDKQQFVVTTESQTNVILAGANVEAIEDLTALAQIGGNRSDGSIIYRLGLQKKLGSKSTVSALVRQDTSGSVSIDGEIPDKGITGQISYNFDFSKSPTERHSIEYQFTFGQ